MPINMTNASNIVPFQLAADVVQNGTVTVGYPAHYSKGNYLLSNSQHKLVIGQNVYTSPKDFTLTFNANASSITVTNKGASTWPSGAACDLELHLSGIPSPSYSGVAQDALAPLNPGLITMSAVALDLGSPNAGAANNICASQAVAAAGNLTLNGTLVTGGVAAMDVPRTLQFVSSNAGDTSQTVTITGLDEYGATTVETITLNGTTSVKSAKALKSVSQLTASAALAGNITVGASNVLGLPIAIYKSAVQVLKESQDGATATAGTFVDAVVSTPSATTGDVRGTYLPNATPDGSKGFLLFAMVPDRSDIGVPQFGG